MSKFLNSSARFRRSAVTLGIPAGIAFAFGLAARDRGNQKIRGER